VSISDELNVDFDPRGQPETGRESAVKVWALIGAAALGMIVVGLARWLAAGPRATNPGPDPYPYLVALRLVEAAGAILLVSLFALLVVRPLLRRRPVGFDGMLMVACLLVHFVDPTFSYFSPSFIQNSHSVQWGSWADYIPGYASPAGAAGFVEGLLWAATLYGVFGIVAALGGCAILMRLRRRWPARSDFTHYIVLFGIFCVFDFIIENFFVRTQIYLFWGSWSPLTLWTGQLYQFPLYETFLAVVYALGFVWLRDSVDARGLSAVERGADDLGRARRLAGPIRFCAITGFCLVWGLVSYFMPFNWMAMKSDAYPALPSYLRGGVFCGVTGRAACPSQYLREITENYKRSDALQALTATGGRGSSPSPTSAPPH
jgi:Spirocyclase AveC-like